MWGRREEAGHLQWDLGYLRGSLAQTLGKWSFDQALENKNGSVKLSDAVTSWQRACLRGVTWSHSQSREQGLSFVLPHPSERIVTLASNSTPGQTQHFDISWWTKLSPQFSWTLETNYIRLKRKEKSRKIRVSQVSHSLRVERSRFWSMYMALDLSFPVCRMMYKPVFLKYLHASELPGGPLKTKIARPHPRVCDSVYLVWNPGVYTNEFPGDTDVAGSRTKLWESLVSSLRSRFFYLKTQCRNQEVRTK